MEKPTECKTHKLNIRFAVNEPLHTNRCNMLCSAGKKESDEADTISTSNVIHHSIYSLSIFQS